MIGNPEEMKDLEDLKTKKITFDLPYEHWFGKDKAVYEQQPAGVLEIKDERGERVIKRISGCTYYKSQHDDTWYPETFIFEKLFCLYTVRAIILSINFSFHGVSLQT
ncbi:terminase DNA packaging enzyme large subunit [Aeromonas phage AP1]|nr:terminase DNA packaging enzyme large subunit [Aeromonas phage AP1]